MALQLHGPAQGRRNSALGSGALMRLGLGKGPQAPGAAQALVCGCVHAGVRYTRVVAGQGEGRLEVLLRLLQCCAVWTSPARGCPGAALSRRWEDNGARRRKDRSLGPLLKPSRRPAHTAALALEWSGCLYPFDLAS